MVWGTDSGKIQEERLNRLGLYCYGGGSKEGQMSYRIYSDNDKKFKLELTQKEFDNIEEYFKIYTRSRKLNKIKLKING